ncbi:MAG TPA: DUF4386 domain-containing protein [Polyangiales bacterium]
MTTRSFEAPSMPLVRGLGLCLLLTLLIPLANWELMFTRLIVVDDVLATVRALLGHELLFRAALLVQVIVAVGAAGMGCLMYLMLKSISPGLSLLALVLRLIEAALIAALPFVGFLAIQLLDRVAVLGTAASELLEGCVGLFLQGYMALWAISMLFFGLGACLFFQLLRRSGYISARLASAGVVAYALVLAMAVLTLLAPELAASPIVQACGYSPSVLFEALAGPYILIRGTRA